MKKLFCFFLIVTKISYSQKFIKSNDCIKSELGFIYYLNNDNIFFASIKKQIGLFNDSSFTTSNLNMAFQLNSNQIILDTLSKYSLSKKLKNFNLFSNTKLKLIPVRLHYKIYKYEKSRKQYKDATSIDYFEFSEKTVRVRTIGGVPIHILDIEIIPH